MKLHTAALAALTGFSLCAVSSLHAAEASFAGKWKVNAQKSKLTGLTYKVEDAGSGQYSFVFGDDKETLGFDGKEHMTKFGNSWSITPAGKNSWKWVSKRDGKVIDDATWTVAEDGATSTYVNTAMRPDGSTSKDETKLKRTGGSPTATLVGSWDSTDITVGTPGVMEITANGNSYTMKNPTYKSETDFKTDGKEYTPKGPQVAAGTTMTAKAEGTDKMELTYQMKGKNTETDRWELSADGKTLTETDNYPGESKAQVVVFDRQ